MALLATLDADKRSVFSLHEIEPFPMSEVAAIVGLHWRFAAMTILVVVGLGLVSQLNGDGSVVLAKREAHSWTPYPPPEPSREPDVDIVRRAQASLAKSATVASARAATFRAALPRSAHPSRVAVLTEKW